MKAKSIQRKSIGKGRTWFLSVFAALPIVFMTTISSLTFWAWYWLAWFVVGFIIPEVYWAVVNGANTVSSNTFRFESLDMGHPFDFANWTVIHWTFAVVFIVFMILLGVHLIFGLGG